MKPLILDFIEKRKENEQVIQYTYSFTQKLNVAVIGNQTKIFIDLEHEDLECLTKTKVHRENDDNNLHFELSTKTEVRKERDDYVNPILEFSTKTFVRTEKDDENPSYN